MKKLLVAAVLALAVPALARAADEAKPADKSAKKVPPKKDPKAGDTKKADDAAKK